MRFRRVQGAEARASQGTEATTPDGLGTAVMVQPDGRRPKVYIAAAFRQFSSWAGPHSSQAYGEIADASYVELLEAIEREFINFGFATCLPHRDEGRWGAVYYEPPAISALCFRHVETSDVIFALAEEGRGVHLELGYAAGLGAKPMILMYREGTEPSTLLWGLPGVSPAWKGMSSPTTTAIMEYGDRDDLLRRLRQTLQKWSPVSSIQQEAIDSRIGLVDIGSHTVKFQIQRRRGGRLVEVVTQTRWSIGLIDEVVSTGRLSQLTIDALVDHLAELKADCDANHCESVAVIGTAALRQAPNVEDLSAALQSRLGWDLEVLDQSSELEYVVSAVAAELDTVEPLAVLNVGGGSVQLAVVSNGRADVRTLLDFGTKELTHDWPWDGPISDADHAALLQSVGNRMRAALPPSARASRLVHTGGELDFLLRCIVPMHTSNLSPTHVSEITTGDFEVFSDQFRAMSRLEASKAFGLDPAWAIGSVASNAIALSAARSLGCEAIVPSNINVTDGIALSRLNLASGSGI